MAKKKSYGDYVVLGGRKLPVEKHPTDFSVMAPEDQLREERVGPVTPMSPVLTRASAPDSEERDRAMEEVRRQRVAHHIYQVKATGEELVIDDRIILELRREGTGELERILEAYHLVPVGRVGGAHLLRLTDATGRNPVRLAGELAEREEVASAEPQVMMDLQRLQSLHAEQWHLDASSLHHLDLSARMGIGALEAWEITRGDPDVVVAVIDDGFDLGHPAFEGARVHADAFDFARRSGDVSPGEGDYHGTPVASIISSPHGPGSPLLGIAPGCTLLPIRIPFGSAVSPEFLLEVFRYASERADVVNCSFGRPPASADQIPAAYRRELARLCEVGGRRGRGLVVVFSAANHDAPTFLRAEENKNGVLYHTQRGGRWELAEIPKGQPVFSGFPMTPGVVTVGAVSSLGRKSGYSCWGPHVTVVAPSSNLHYIPAVHPSIADERRALFEAEYRGLGLVAAVNRPGHGLAYKPIPDDRDTPDVREDLYTREFGGTSGAAPVVAGVAALMLSANLDLSAEAVRQILMATADTDLDPSLDLDADPNLQGLTGEFSRGRSRYFGAGKVNAFRAVRRARALRLLAEQARPSLPYDPSERLQMNDHLESKPFEERDAGNTLSNVLERLQRIEALLASQGERSATGVQAPLGWREPFDDREPFEEGHLEESRAGVTAASDVSRFSEDLSRSRLLQRAQPAASESERLEAFIDRFGFRFFRGFELTPYWSRTSKGVQNSVPPEGLWPFILLTLTVLDRLRDELGVPIQLTSTYRSPVYNGAVGGVRLSQHTQFRAIDFTCSAGRPEEWGRMLRSYRSQSFVNPHTGDAFAFRGGIGTYPSKGFVHVDTRGWDADWSG